MSRPRAERPDTGVFLTGGSGGLGSLLALRLAGEGLTVLALARDPSRLPTHDLIRPVPGDLLDPATYRQALAGATDVVHLAAATHLPDPAGYERVNVEGTRRLIEAAREAGLPGRVLYVGTRATGAACGAYGASKARAEDLVRQSGLAFVIVRPAEVWGLSSREALARLVDQVARGPVVIAPGSGGHVLAPVHAHDVVQALTQALARPEALGKVYTLAGPEAMTYLELVRRLQDRAGVRRPVIRPPLWVLSLAARAFALLGLSRPPLVPDQIPRLSCPKDTDIGPARRDLGFDPRPFAPEFGKPGRIG